MRITRMDPKEEWKPGTSDYVAAHQVVQHERGKAKTCSNCESSSAEWANLTGNYHDPFDFVQLCVPCHRAFDRKKFCAKGHMLPEKGHCKECKKISRRNHYHRNKMNLEWSERRRKQTREAQQRYRERKNKCLNVI